MQNVGQKRIHGQRLEKIVEKNKAFDIHDPVDQHKKQDADSTAV
jgi:hypothetical protein